MAEGISRTCPCVNPTSSSDYSLCAEADDRLYNCVTQVPGQCVILPRQYSYPLGTYIIPCCIRDLYIPMSVPMICMATGLQR